MTISDDARTLFDRLDLQHDDALLLAKATAQRLIDESATGDRPLNGLVYDVWGLYNDGTPKCRFEAPYENKEEIVFTGQFRRAGEDGFVVERTVLSLDDVRDILRSIAR
jgi:hypothetical protein